MRKHHSGAFDRAGLWGTAADSYLAGCPVDPAFAIGVDVEQNQPLDQVREDQLRAQRHMYDCPRTEGTFGFMKITAQCTETLEV